MEEKTIEELKAMLSREQAQNKALIEEIDVKNRTIKLLIVAKHLDEDVLEQATSLAGGL